MEEELNLKSIEYRKKHKQEKALKDKEYRLNNKDKINKRNRERKKVDAKYKLICQLRGAIKNSFRRKSQIKSEKNKEILGCDTNFMIDYLISTYEKNYNEKWNDEFVKDVHVDHIIPLSTATTKEEIKKLCHYTNLQLLKSKDNLKKSNNVDWSINNE